MPDCLFCKIININPKPTSTTDIPKINMLIISKFVSSNKVTIHKPKTYNKIQRTSVIKRMCKIFEGFIIKNKIDNQKIKWIKFIQF